MKGEIGDRAEIVLRLAVILAGRLRPLWEIRSNMHITYCF